MAPGRRYSVGVRAGVGLGGSVPGHGARRVTETLPEVAVVNRRSVPTLSRRLFIALATLSGVVPAITVPLGAAAAGGPTIETIAGSLGLGFSGDGGPATAAQISIAVSGGGVAGHSWGTNGIAVAPDGGFYFADSGRVRKVANDGTITTIAGTGTAGFSGDGGPAVLAKLARPADVATDNDGNLYIADQINGRIRKVHLGMSTPPEQIGTITTVAGGGTSDLDDVPATQAKFIPRGVAVKGNGDIYLSTRNAVKKIDRATGLITTVAGGPDPRQVGGPASDGLPARIAGTYFPADLAFDAAGQLYIGEGHRVRRVNADGIITTVAGSGSLGSDGDGGPAVQAKVVAAGIAVAGSTLYIADAYNSRVRRVDLQSGIITTAAGTGTAGFSGDGTPATGAMVSRPGGVATVGSDVYITDAGNNVIRKLIASPTPRSADLSLTLTSTPEEPNSSDITYIAQITNRGPDAAQDVRLSVVFPEKSSHTSFELSQGRCSFADPVYNCELATLGRELSASVRITASAAKGTVTAALTSATPDPVTGNNRAELSNVPPGTPPSITTVSPGQGPVDGGTAVKLIGAGFVPGDTKVSFGSFSSEQVAVMSSVELTAVTPPQHRGTVPLTVTTSFGSAVTSFSYESGGWINTGRLDGCLNPENPLNPDACKGRYGHSATLLDGPKCRSDAPPAYCGSVLVAGGTSSLYPAFTGDRTSPYSSSLLFDPVAGTWAPTRGRMIERPRFAHAATLLDGPECQVNSGAPSYCGWVLVTGGRGQTGAETAEGSDSRCPGCPVYACLPGLTCQTAAPAELYDPETGVWSRTTPLPDARFFHTATLLDGPDCRNAARPAYCGRVLVTGGALGGVGEARASTFLYDPATGAWESQPPMSTARISHTATLLANGDVLVAGGATDTDEVNVATDLVPLQSTEIYRPSSPGWRAGPDMSTPRWQHSATPLDSHACGRMCGKVLVAGSAVGKTEDQTFSSAAELFDPAGDGGKGAWKPLPLMRIARGGHTATSLSDGTVLVTGLGYTFETHVDTYRNSATAEIFDPKANSGRGRWSVATEMSDARGNQTATLLDGPACRRASAPNYCGRVLVAGGAGAGDADAPPALASAEIYAPAPDIRSVRAATGPTEGGGEVVVTGDHFGDVQEVRFGDTPAAALTVTSPTSLSVTAPAHPKGPVDVTVVTVGGSSQTVTANPAARYTFVGLPDAIKGLRADPVSTTEIELRFLAPDDGTGLAPANSYVVKQSTAPITSETFADATTVCEPPRCAFTPTEVGQELTLRVGDLLAGSEYHYAMRPVGADGRLGEMSDSVEVRTFGTAAEAAGAQRRAAIDCLADVAPAPGQLRFPAGYSLVGLPSTTVVSAQSPLYGWMDQGAGRSYVSRSPADGTVAGHGYWAWFACPTLVTLPAAGSSSVSLPLAEYHASMVGNPSGTSTATVTGHDFAARWDPSANGGVGGYSVSGYREPQELAVGEGLWTFSYQRTDIRIASR